VEIANVIACRGTRLLTRRCDVAVASGAVVLAASLPAWIRWTQGLHFLITPRDRTTTSDSAPWFERAVLT